MAYIEGMESKGTTIRERIGYEPFEAAFIGRDWSLTRKAPRGQRLERSEWEASKRALSTILPQGCTIRHGEDSATVGYDAKGIPSVILPDGSVMVRLGSSYMVESFLRDMLDATVEC